MGGSVYLGETRIKSLNELEHVGGSLTMNDSKIKDFGNLQFVGNILDISHSPLAKKYTEEEIREMIHVGGRIYM